MSPTSNPGAGQSGFVRIRYSDSLKTHQKKAMQEQAPGTGRALLSDNPLIRTRTLPVWKTERPNSARFTPGASLLMTR